MTPEQMAILHSRAFDGQGRPWSIQEFASLLDSPHVFCVSDEFAFALGRAIAGEAELLTLATDPAEQRQGLGRKAVKLFEAEAQRRGAEICFLEVAADNHAAIALYQSGAYHEIARREAYYEKPSGDRVDAIVFQKVFISDN